MVLQHVELWCDASMWKRVSVEAQEHLDLLVYYWEFKLKHHVSMNYSSIAHLGQ